MLLRFVSIVCLLLALGCEQGRMKNVADVMMDTTPEEVVEMTEPELPTINFEPEFEVPTIPEGVDIFPEDRVLHKTELVTLQLRLDENGEPVLWPDGDVHFYDPFIFDDAVSALSDEEIPDFFKFWEVNIENFCKSGRLHDSGKRLIVYFTQREEADKFATQFVDVNPWNIFQPVTVINSEKVYFSVYISTTFEKVRAFCEE